MGWRARGDGHGISFSGKAGETLDRIRAPTASVLVETTAGDDGYAAGWHVWQNVVGGWSWSACGPRGRETGSAPDRGEAERRAQAAERGLRKASPR
jgi:hypothetical protein